MDLINETYERLDKYVTDNKIDVLISLFSGGGDSIAATLLASKHPAFVGCIHVNTKTSPLSEMASQQAIAKMERFGWDYVVTSPYTTFRQYITKMGFPGSGVHGEIYDLLKGRPIAHARQLWTQALNGKPIDTNYFRRASITQATQRVELKPEHLINGKKPKAKKYKVALITGIRRNESQRRQKMNYAEHRQGAHWLAPLLEWRKMEVNRYLSEHQVYNVGSSRDGDSIGECDCRCFASTGENEVKTNYNDIMKRYTQKLEELARISRELDLIEVEAGMRSNNFVMEEHHTSWGWVADKADTRTIAELPLFSICNDCHGQLTEDGRGGYDPDSWLVARKEQLTLQE